MSRLVDLTGQAFGKLTVLERADDYVSPSGRKFAQWQCKCECGKEIIVIGLNLKNGKTKSCGCLRPKSDTNRGSMDLTGQRFSRLTVISRAEDKVDKNSGSRSVCWKCVCDCGNEKIVRTQNLVKGTTKSCGCLRQENMEHTRKQSRNSFIDLTGQTFGKFTVLARADDYISPSGHRLVQWHCKCECGKDTIVAGNELRRGTTLSCGCLKAELVPLPQLTDLTGQRFSRLTVISRAEDKVDKKSGHRFSCWKCVCDCGNETIVRAASLKTGRTKSCGCLRRKTPSLSQASKE